MNRLHISALKWQQEPITHSSAKQKQHIRDSWKQIPDMQSYTYMKTCREMYPFLNLAALDIGALCTYGMEQQFLRKDYQKIIKISYFSAIPSD